MKRKLALEFFARRRKNALFFYVLHVCLSKQKRQWKLILIFDITALKQNGSAGRHENSPVTRGYRNPTKSEKAAQHSSSL